MALEYLLVRMNLRSHDNGSNMYRRASPRDHAGNPRSAGSTSVPSTFRNRYEAERSRRYAARPSGRSTFRLYGPPRTRPSRHSRDRRYWSFIYPDSAADDEKVEKEKEKELEKKRLPKEEVKKLQVLTVEDVSFNIVGNALMHHTLKYDCIKGENAQPVFRRGQEFDVTVTFDRAYQKDKDDLFFVLEADEENPGKNLKERFQLDEDGSDTYRKDEDWGARILESDSDKKTLKLAVYIPGDCVIGEWDVKVKTSLQGSEKKFVYRCPQPMIILFNPWSSVDQVHFTEKEDLLNEYILNDVGSIFVGTAHSIGSRPWTYGQFDKGILDICLSILRKAFGFKMSPSMADPVMVARALSRIINDCDDKGVLVGNWSGDYEGGAKPTSWTSSTAILRKYEETGQPVKYGQCWVFSHLLTAVSRALGLPCRSVTNFDSAHDTDNTCTIDTYYDEEGEELKHLKSDSIWNFHVWNEVWILRPDLQDNTYDGWHVVDATPQEQSCGMFQCGPCPVAAVKRGEINVGYDTAFVFSEVNAEVVNWVCDPDEEIKTHSSIKRDYVGNQLSTKTPDGKAHLKKLSYFHQDDPSLRLDLTDTYKFDEGTPEEREAVRRAVRFSRHGGRLFKKSSELEVTFDRKTQTMIGKDLVITSYVNNVSKEDKAVDVIMAVRTCTYWNNSVDDKALEKKTLPRKTIKAGQTEQFQVTVTPQKYLESCDESYSVYAYVCAKDVAANMPYSSQQPFRLRTPDLDIKGPKSAKSGEQLTVTASFTNPLQVPLTNCHLEMTGNLDLHEDDKNDFEFVFWSKLLQHKNVKAGEKVTLTFLVVGEVDDEEDGRVKTMDMVFNSNEISTGITGAYVVELNKPVPK
ncbi:annulin-like isoform X2 [Littorina saxatilis]|uniref:Transglutaminase-like domain-containing protein n=1 Tax=Littorina saxatilis TaxID=31220 RepID=A0AAN9C099_9CAEN